jgi:hypothetical protein
MERRLRNASRTSHFIAVGAVLATCLVVAGRSAAQPAASIPELPRCTGAEPARATSEFEAGNALMEEALREARSGRLPRAQELAARALVHFDRQCELGDLGGYAERGAALILLGEPLRSAQAYDAYLSARPLETLDARTRRRIEANLQPGSISVEVENAVPGARLFVDELDFGELVRRHPLRLPLGTHHLEARDPSGRVLASATVAASEQAPSATVRLVLPTPEPETASASVPPSVPDAVSEPAATPGERETPSNTPVDHTPWYATTIAVAGVGLGVGIGFLAAVEERAQTYNSVCTMGMAIGCEAVLSEREAFIGLSVAGFVLAGLGVAGLITVAVLDGAQTREEPRLRLGATPGGAALELAVAF